MYEYRVINVAKVIDGDTYDLDLDLGFYATLRVRVRLAGVDTYEVYGKNAHPLGTEARDFAARWMAEAQGLAVRTYKLNAENPVADGSFGRWAAEVIDWTSGEGLATALREAGYVEEG